MDREWFSRYAVGPAHTLSRLKFIMEGILTLLVAIGSIWMVHDWPDQARFLTPLEREMVITRIRAEQGLAGEGSFGTAPVVAALKDYKTYVLMLMYMGAAVPLYRYAEVRLPYSVLKRRSVARYSPPVSSLPLANGALRSLFSSARLVSLLACPVFAHPLTPPAYALTFVTTLATAWYSDKIRRRGFFLMFW